MHYTFRYPLLLGLIVLSCSNCKKQSTNIGPVASIRIINTVTGGKAVRLNDNTTAISNNIGSISLVIPAALTDLYVWPQGDSLEPYYTNNKVDVAANGIYSLFLGGTPGATEGILIKENFPYVTDSMANIRFVHLSPNGPTVNVTLSTAPAVNEFAGVTYKGITEFRSFPARSSNASYTFQVRNATTNAVITSVSMSGAALASFVPRFRYVTLVFRGNTGGTPAPGITRVNHYATIF